MTRSWVRMIFDFALIVAAGLVIAGVLLARPVLSPPVMKHGVSFSAPLAQSLVGDWKYTYRAILEDLRVKHLRLSAYWNEVEPIAGEYDFEDLDWQMDEAARHNARVILAVGRKLPRWPECHEPGWIKDKSEEEIKDQALVMLSAVVSRYKDHPALRMWQLENEPLLDFGECPPEDRGFLEEEERLLRSLDKETPILITDSGELNWWLDAAKYGDVLGTTMYRTVYSQRTEELFTYDYLFPSWLYRAKARAVKLIRGKEVLISELQGEPWGLAPFSEMSKQDRMKSFSPERFKEIKQFAERTQLGEAYWWGVEYWHWEKEKKNDNRYWEFAKNMF